MSALIRMQAILPEGSYTQRPDVDGVLTLDLQSEALAQALPRLANEAAFETITLVTAIDHATPFTPMAKGRFEVCYQFLSITHGDRVRLCLFVDGDQPIAPSACPAFAGAGYMERECFDMFGIEFEGHENLRRLLMPDGFTHFPLRKDFPHQGIEPDKLYREWHAQREARANAEVSPQ